jgi:pyrroline-5-carboxylate reductase
MTTLTAGRHANSDFKSLAHLLFSSMGQTVELPESCMDMATAIAGSGPAYAFSFIEAAARQGERQGIAYETALKMAAQTFLGAAKMLLQAGVSVQEQINQIAVPNGTTEAGLKVLKDLEIEKKFQDVLSAAAARSQAISQHRFS